MMNYDELHYTILFPTHILVTMYIPSSFQANLADAQLIIKQYPFATLMTVLDGQLNVTQIPLIFRDEHTLIGHMARANPHSKAFINAQGEINATVLFTGPNTYISPAWYVKNTGVPTWNYAAVQVQGQVHMLQTLDDTESVVKTLIETFDSQADTVKAAWSGLPPAAQTAQLGAILAFEIKLNSIDVKCKLSQNRPVQDQHRVKQQLALGDAQAVAVAHMMQPPAEKQ